MFLRRRKLLSDRARLGQWGEKRAERLLANKGLKTLTRNFSCKTGEIDLVMVNADRTIVFVEVKTRADETFGPPEQSVTYSKRDKLLRTARYFLATHEIEDRPYRLDVVAIVLGPRGSEEIRHYPNAVTP